MKNNSRRDIIFSRNGSRVDVFFERLTIIKRFIVFIQCPTWNIYENKIKKQISRNRVNAIRLLKQCLSAKKWRPSRETRKNIWGLLRTCLILTLRKMSNLVGQQFSCEKKLRIVDNKLVREQKRLLSKLNLIWCRPLVY